MNVEVLNLHIRLLEADDSTVSEFTPTKDQRHLGVRLQVQAPGVQWLDAEALDAALRWRALLLGVVHARRRFESEGPAGA